MAILRLIEPSGGRVRFESTDVAALNGAQLTDLRKQMQIIFQDPYSSLNPRMTVRRILGDPMRIHGLYDGPQCEERVAYLMEKVGLTPEQANRYPHQFSGGQRQRIGIARALALSPRLIIGDEPVSALDVSIRAQIINLLIDLQQEFALSYIIISHDLAVVEHICDRIAVMYLGKIVELAPFKDLYSNPRHPYTQALMSAVPTADPRTRKQRIILEGDVPNPIDPPAGCRFHPRCPRRFGPCAGAEPPLAEAAPGHSVACLLPQ
jgi:oligopeptide/dipeptide ABC transporter ATP-binding protein